MAEEIAAVLRRGARVELTEYDPLDVEARGRRLRRARQRRTLAGVVTAVIAISISVAVLVPEPRRAPEPTQAPPTTAAATPSPPGTRSAGDWVPPTREEGGYAVMPLTFLDGTTAEIRYPKELNIAGLGGRPHGSAELVGRAFEGCCARDFAFFHRSTAPGRFPLAASDQPIAEFPGVEGGPVRLLPGLPAANTDFLVFDIREWRLGVWDSMTDEQRELWSRHLGGRIAPDGFPVLTATPPLRLDDWAGEAYGPAIEFGHVGGRQISFSPIKGCPSPSAEQDRLPGGEVTLVLCRPGWRMRVNVVADQPFVDAVTKGLEVRDVRLVGG